MNYMQFISENFKLLVIILLTIYLIVLLIRLKMRSTKIIDIQSEIDDLNHILHNKDILYRKALTRVNNNSDFYADLIERISTQIHLITTTHNVRKITKVAIDTIVEIFRPDRAVFFTRVKRDDTLILADGYGLQQNKIGSTYSLNNSKPGHVVLKGLTMIRKDFDLESTIVRKRIMSESDIDCQMDIFTPITNENEVIGVIGMQKKDSELSKEEHMLFKLIGNVVSNSIMFAYLIAKYRNQANLDGLTQLTNKKQFLLEFGKTLVESESNMEPLSLFIFDIDNFKHYNDRNGHPDGDELLKQLSELIKSHIRITDIAARYGGEEFIVMFPGTAKTNACKIAEGILKVIEEYPFKHREFQPLGYISVSGGISSYPEDGTSTSELIRLADQRLYKVKNSGKNNVICK